MSAQIEPFISDIVNALTNSFRTKEANPGPAENMGLNLLNFISYCKILSYCEDNQTREWNKTRKCPTLQGHVTIQI